MAAEHRHIDVLVWLTHRHSNSTWDGEVRRTYERVVPLLYGVPPIDGRQRQLAAQWWRKTRLSTKRWLKMYRRGEANRAVVEECLQRGELLPCARRVVTSGSGAGVGSTGRSSGSVIAMDVAPSPPRGDVTADLEMVRGAEVLASLKQPRRTLTSLLSVSMSSAMVEPTHSPLQLLLSRRLSVRDCPGVCYCHEVPENPLVLCVNSGVSERVSCNQWAEDGPEVAALRCKIRICEACIVLLMPRGVSANRPWKCPYCNAANPLPRRVRQAICDAIDGKL
jgi:hypothetical protein